MALYTDDKSVIRLIRSTVGFGLVCDYIGDREGYPVVLEFRDNSVCLIQTYCKGFESVRGMVSNTVTIGYDKICVNPVYDKLGNNYTKELYEYILGLGERIIDRRDERINEVLTLIPSNSTSGSCSLTCLTTALTQLPCYILPQEFHHP